MREIKFRAWDKIGYRMLKSPLMHPDLIRSVDKPQYISLDRALTRPDFELMQYTGLKDKNGVEIYEGDVVRLCGINFELVGEVAFRNCCYMVDSCNGNRADLLRAVDTPEVIGNIYENPELLR